MVMGPDATISWSQVTSKPSIPTLPSYIKSTYIDSTRIESPLIIGGEGRGGSITSDTDINVTKDAYIGAKLYLDVSKAYMGGIDFDVASIDVDPASGAMFLEADGAIRANGHRIDVPPVAVFG